VLRHLPGDRGTRPGPLEQVCGAVAAVKPGGKVTAWVMTGEQATCSVRVGA